VRKVKRHAACHRRDCRAAHAARAALRFGNPLSTIRQPSGAMLQRDAMVRSDETTVTPVTVWAAFVRRSADQPHWRLEALSVLGPHRARALAEREHARHCVVGAQFRVVEYASITEIPDRLEA
jgi:hypothetical protein